MPHASLWFSEPDYSKEDVKNLMDKVALKAEELGYFSKGGIYAGRGNITELLIAIANGKVICLRQNELETD